MKNADLSETIIQLLFWKNYYNDVKLYVRECHWTAKYCEGNRVTYLEKVIRYYEENKGRLQKLTGDWYSTLSEEEKYKNKEYGKNRCQNKPKENTKHKKVCQKIANKICLEKTNKKRKIHERIQKNILAKRKTFIEKINENNELQSVEVDGVTNFIKDEVESSSDAEVYTNDDYHSEKDRVTGFR